jgi:hypothetical protein
MARGAGSGNVGAIAHLVLSTFKGGRNGADPPTLVPPDQCLEAQTVDLFNSALGRKRPGSDSIGLGGGTAFTAPLNFLKRHLPSADETAAELWGIDAAATPVMKRLAGGTTWANVTFKDNITSRPQDTDGISFNGKFFIGAKTGVDRLQVYDPASSTTVTRRTGIAAPTAAPTTSLSGGAVTDTRTYKTAVTVQASGVTQRRSELSAASGSTSPSSQQVTVTMAGAPGEGETHWELYGASTDGVYKLIGTATIATTTQVDNNATLTGSLAPLVGTNALFPSVKYLATDGNRILGAGANEANGAQSAGKSSRVWFTPPFVNPGDDERNPTTTQQNYYIDFNELDGGFITGMAGQFQGAVFVFKYRQIWKMTPTGSATAPYSVIPISRVVGSIDHKTIRLGRDEQGQPALYFLSADGPYRIGTYGLQYMGRDVEDIWATVNLDATNKVAHGVYYPAIHQMWWWVATGTSNDPNLIICYDNILGRAIIYPVGDQPPSAGVRRGWAKFTGDLATCRCSEMFSATLGASMGRLLKPYAGFVTSLKLFRADSTTAYDDAGTPYQSFVKTKHYEAGGDHFFDLERPALIAGAQATVTVRVSAIVDWGMQPTRSVDVSLTPASTETFVTRGVEGLASGRATACQFQIGDAAAQSVTWRLEQFRVPVFPTDLRTP